MIKIDTQLLLKLGVIGFVPDTGAVEAIRERRTKEREQYARQRAIGTTYYQRHKTEVCKKFKQRYNSQVERHRAEALARYYANHKINKAKRRKVNKLRNAA